MAKISRSKKIAFVVSMIAGFMLAFLKDRFASSVSVQSFVEAIFASFLLLACICLATSIVRKALLRWKGRTPRSETTALLAGTLVGEISFFLFLLLHLHNRGLSLADFGLGRTSSATGWIGAFLVTSVYCGYVLAVSPKAEVKWRGLIATHLFNCLCVGTVAAFCEEILFRGFIMTRLAQAGFSPTFQVLASGILFGAAHIGIVPDDTKSFFKYALMAVASTCLLGCLLGSIYLLGERALTPVILAHAAVNVITGPGFVSAFYTYFTQKGLEQAS